MTATTWILVLAGAAALAVGVYFFLRPRAAEGEAYFHFQCPACNRKLHIRASKAGKKGICPRCKAACVYPTSDLSEIPRPVES